MVFKLGLIADIHGDLYSLTSALNLLKSQHVDVILCAGDLVERGEHGDAVVRLIHEEAIPCVLGNHDEAAPTNQRWLREDADLTHPNMRGRLLEANTIDYLRNLPRTARFNWENLDILLVHGTPKSNVDYLMPHNSPDKYLKIAHESEADAIIFGHTHIPMQAHFGNVRFFNPGSVWGGREDSTCATLRLPDFTFKVFDLVSGSEISVPCVRDDASGTLS